MYYPPLRTGAVALLTAVAGLGLAADPRTPDQEPRERATLTEHPGHLTALAYSSDGKLLISAGRDGVITLWDTATNKTTAKFAGNGILRTVAISPDGKTVAAAGRAGPIKLWDVASGKNTATFAGNAPC